MQTLKIKWTGYRPLLMHSSAMIDPDNASVREIKKLEVAMKKLKKDDYDGREKYRRQIERLEWEGSLYWDGSQMFVPGENIHACIVEGARKAKVGKRAEAAILPPEDVPVISSAKPGTTLDDLYTRKEFSLRKPVRIPPRTGARIMKVRPIIPTGWELQFEIDYDEEQLPKDDLITAMEDAGSLVGIGDWRPKFGRFKVEAS
jgi:hypothetical protein